MFGVEVVVVVAVVVVESICERLGSRSVGLRRRSDIDVRALGLRINSRQRVKLGRRIGSSPIVGSGLE